MNSFTELNFTQSAQVSTASATHYLNRLCKHFSHKVHSEWSQDIGFIDFGIGQCWLLAKPLELHVRCEANNVENLIELMDTLTSHFNRFARREGLTLAISEIL